MHKSFSYHGLGSQSLVNSTGFPVFLLTAKRGHPRYGEVAERLKALVLKTSEGRPSVGSNPTLSAIATVRCSAPTACGRPSGA